MKKSLIIANWKMNPQTPQEAQRLLHETGRISAAFRREVEIVVCPPFVYLPLAKKRKADFPWEVPRGVGFRKLGAQDCFWENPSKGGAYTGEISATMLKQHKVRFVIVGHSERREYFGETNAVVAKKIAATLAAGLTPILCVGERARDDASSYLSFVKEELKEGLSMVKKLELSRIVIAYEPIWAIGTDEKPITPKAVCEMNLYIKKILYGIWGANSSSIRIIYGGSVAPGYAAEFLIEGGMTGLLIGHQSLKPKSLEKIAKEVSVIRFKN